LIVGVNLIVPKPGVFIPDIKYLLVLTTPVEIIVLGKHSFSVSIKQNLKVSLPISIKGLIFGQNEKNVMAPMSAFDEMQLMNKPIFVLNTDNVAITCIEGTADGRIFMGGRDGCLYEIAYQAESDWFGKRCKKINHSQGLMSLIVPGFLKVINP
jgi:nuclear pore complex protein Nup155